MPLFTTTLSAAVTPSQLGIPVATTANLIVGQPLQIDGELMVIAGPITAQQVKVRMRGSEGTAAVAHDVGAIVLSGTADAFPAIPPATGAQRPVFVEDIVTLGQDQNVAVPLKNTTYLIAKGSVAALTLLAATAAQVGVVLTFIATTAFAHTLTYAPGFQGTTTASDLATFDGTIGASMVVQVSANGTILPVALTRVTIS